MARTKQTARRATRGCTPGNRGCTNTVSVRVPTSRRVNTQSILFFLRFETGDPYRDTESSNIGIFSSKLKAVTAACEAMTDLSETADMRQTHAFQFEHVIDRTNESPNDGVLIDVRDNGGSFDRILISSHVIDEQVPYKPQNNLKQATTNNSNQELNFADDEDDFQS